MHFQVLFFEMFRALSLITWYADSPPTANHGMRLANCTDLSVACLTASQNALNELHQRQGKERLAKNQEAGAAPVGDTKTKEEREQSTSAPLYQLSFLGIFNDSVKINISMNGRQKYRMTTDPKRLGALDLSFLPGMAAVLARENDTAKKVPTTDPPSTGDRNGSGGLTGRNRFRIHVRGDLERWSLTLLSVCTMLYCCYSHRKSLWRWCCGMRNGKKRQEPVIRYRDTFAKAIKNSSISANGASGRQYNRRLPVNRYRDILRKGVRNTGISVNVDGDSDEGVDWESE